MSDWFLGEIRLFPMGWAPDGWHVCDGSPMSVQGNPALFALLGTTYGGDGRSTFNLPDLRGRAIVHQNQNDSSGYYVRGKAYGVEGVALTATQIPPHQHLFTAISTVGTALSPKGNFFSSAGTTTGVPTPPNLYAAPGTAPVQLTSGTLAPAGEGKMHNNMQPYLVLNYCIAIQGIFPPRN